MPEPDSEHQCTGDREQCRAELVGAALSEHVVDQLRGRRVEPVVMDERVRQRVRMRVEVLLHDQHRRQDGYQDVEGEEGRLQRPFHRPVTPPGPDHDSATRTGSCRSSQSCARCEAVPSLALIRARARNLALPTRGLNQPRADDRTPGASAWPVRADARSRQATGARGRRWSSTLSPWSGTCARLAAVSRSTTTSGCLRRMSSAVADRPLPACTGRAARGADRAPR